VMEERLVEDVVEQPLHLVAGHDHARSAALIGR
jgi:hypothetical protein